MIVLSKQDIEILAEQMIKSAKCCGNCSHCKYEGDSITGIYTCSKWGKIVASCDVCLFYFP